MYVWERVVCVYVDVIQFSFFLTSHSQHSWFVLFLFHNFPILHPQEEEEIPVIKEDLGEEAEARLPPGGEANTPGSRMSMPPGAMRGGGGE